MDRLKDLKLTDGIPAIDYVMQYPEERREVIMESILEVSRKGWPLNRVEIGAEARERMRKQLGIK